MAVVLPDAVRIYPSGKPTRKQIQLQAAEARKAHAPSPNRKRAREVLFETKWDIIYETLREGNDYETFEMVCAQYEIDPVPCARRFRQWRQDVLEEGVPKRIIGYRRSPLRKTYVADAVGALLEDGPAPVSKVLRVAQDAAAARGDTVHPCTTYKALQHLGCSSSMPHGQRASANKDAAVAFAEKIRLLKSAQLRNRPHLLAHRRLPSVLRPPPRLP